MAAAQARLFSNRSFRMTEAYANQMPDVARTRLASQGISDPRFRTPRDVVSWLGAVQAQDYLGALWAVGLRMLQAVEADIECALADRSIVRSYPLRGTLHFVAAEDVQWMLELSAPRVLKSRLARLRREFGLDGAALSRARKVVEKTLQGGNALTREELYRALQRARISTASSRGLHITFHLAHEGLICFGPRKGKQQTWVLLEEWIPKRKKLHGEEAMAELARRYFASHAPATAADFAWWSGLPITVARRLAPEFRAEGRERVRAIHLLPPFDEYLVGYKDRSAALDPKFVKQVNAGGGMLNATVVSDGEVVGTWKRTLKGDSVAIGVNLWRVLRRDEKRLLDAAAERYARFLGISSVALS
jgi:hypothetical protein